MKSLIWDILHISHFIYLISKTKKMASSIPLVSPKDLPLEVQMEWYKIRDMFFGRNFVEQNIPLALELAAKCSHPDAQWLTAACAGKEIERRKEAGQVFLALGQEDARAMCFAWLCGAYPEDVFCTFVAQSASRGFAFAKSEAAAGTPHEFELRFKWAKEAAAQGERDAFCIIGFFLKHGISCKIDLEAAKQNVLLGSKLGDVFAMITFGEMCNASDFERWFWWSRAAKKRAEQSFLKNFSTQVELFIDKQKNGRVIFIIGQTLNNQVNAECNRILGFRVGNDDLNAARFAITFYQSQLEASRRAVDEWTKVALRFRVCRDIRKLIGQMIWTEY